MGKKRQVIRAQIGGLLFVLYAFNELERKRLEQLSQTEISLDKIEKFYAEREVRHELDLASSVGNYDSFFGMLRIYTGRWGKTNFYHEVFNKYGSSIQVREKSNRPAPEIGNKTKLCGYLRVGGVCALRKNFPHCESPNYLPNDCSAYSKINRPSLESFRGLSTLVNSQSNR